MSKFKTAYQAQGLLPKQLIIGHWKLRFGYFIIEWGAKSYSNQLFIQSVMIGTYEQQGISFATEAIVIDSSRKD